MKGWKIVKPLTVKEQEIEEQNLSVNRTKVKMTKMLITLSDVLTYSDEETSDSPVLGSYGIGIVSESDTNFFGLEKGKHVFIEPYTPCDECYNCKNGEPEKCSNLLVAGDDYDGFLCDFYSTNSDKLFILPDSVSDYEALFIGEISLAISVVDKLGVQKGDYVSIVGGNNFANILAQLLIYYQAVPIILTTDSEDYEIAKNTGIYYVLGSDDNWQKEVSSITGGRMTKSAVYVSDCNIPISRAFSLVSYGAAVVFTGNYFKNNPISLTQAVKKQLNIHCLNISFGNTAASINLIANKAIDLSHLKIETEKYENVDKVFKNLKDTLDANGKIHETVVNVL